MKITFLAANLDMSGGTRVLEIYARLLQQRGHHVEVYCPGRRPMTLREYVRYWLGRAIAPELDPSVSYFENSPVKAVRVPGKARLDARDLPDADVVIATWWSTAHWVAALPREKGRKFHFIQHYETFGGNPADVDAAWRLPIRKIVISDWLEELARNKFGAQHIDKIYNSVDMQQFHAPERSLQYPPTVGMLYHTARWKGTPEGLEAFRVLQQAIPDAKLLTFGAMPESPLVPLPPGARHVHLPPQDQIRDIYAACDVWLCSSFGEGFHLPPLEAMACRCPVVSTRVGGPADIVKHGVNGYLVDVGDVAGLAAGLTKVLSAGPTQWQAMSDAALDVALSYTWDDAADLFERAILR